LTFLLAANPDIATVGELKASAMGEITTYQCSCGALLQECGFWKQVTEGMASKGMRFSLAEFGTHFGRETPLFRRLIRSGVKSAPLNYLSSRLLSIVPSYNARLNRIIEQNRTLIELITTIQRGRVFLDGSKDPERLKQFLDSSYWRVKVGIAEWLKTEQACQRIFSQVPASDKITIRYEDLCGTPEKVTAAVFGFAGLDVNNSNLGRRHSGFHILGNRTRLLPAREIVLDEKWRVDLTTRELAAFDRLASAHNRVNGYNGY
jgi:hypothetical protein